MRNEMITTYFYHQPKTTSTVLGREFSLMIIHWRIVTRSRVTREKKMQQGNALKIAVFRQRE